MTFTDFLVVLFILQVCPNSVKAYVITTSDSGNLTTPYGNNMMSVENQMVQVQISGPSFSQTDYEKSINKTIIKLTEAGDKATELKTVYASDRMSNDEMLLSLERESHLEGFPVISITPELKAEMKSNRTKGYQHVFTALTNAAVFLEVIAEDEVTYEYRAHSDLIDENVWKLNDILSYIGILSRNFGLTMENNTVTNITKDDIRTSSSQLRHMRDYVIIKDCIFLYSTLEELCSEMTGFLRINSNVV